VTSWKWGSRPRFSCTTTMAGWGPGRLGRDRYPSNVSPSTSNSMGPASIESPPMGAAVGSAAEPAAARASLVRKARQDRLPDRSSLVVSIVHSSAQRRQCSWVH